MEEPVDFSIMTSEESTEGVLCFPLMSYVTGFNFESCCGRDFENSVSVRFHTYRATGSKSYYFVLVHGLGQGAWCWFKLKTLLEAAGHRVSAVDLLGAGTNLKHIDEVDSMLEYSGPLLELMETIPSDEKVVIVGHSLGGMSVAYAMEKLPQKVAVGVFLTAFMPDTVNPPAYVLNKFLEFIPEGMFMDTKFTYVDNGPGKPKTTMHFGPKFQASGFYQCSPPEYCTLGITMTRVGAMFTEELSTALKFSNEGYGSVNRAYIVAKQDKGLLAAYQRKMIENNPVKEVREIEEADHFPMIAKAQEVCHALIEIADKCA